MGKNSTELSLLIVSHSAELAGAERSLIAHASYLKQKGWALTVTIPRRGPIADELRKREIPYRIVPTPLWISERGYGVIGAVRLLLCLLAIVPWVTMLIRTRPAVVITNSIVVPSPAIACRLLRTHHCWVIRESVLTNPSLNCFLRREDVLRIVAVLSSRVFVISRYVREQFRQVVGAEVQIDLAYPPVTGVWEPSLRSAGTNLRVLFAGALTKDKGLEDCIRAFAVALQQTSRIELAVAGAKPKAAVAGAKELARDLEIDDRVEWLGWVSDVPGLLREVDLVLMTSKNEAFGRITAESVLAGVPVLAYDAGGSVEILEKGGGLLCSPNYSALGSSLVQLAESPAKMRSLKASTRGAASVLESANGLQVLENGLSEVVASTYHPMRLLQLKGWLFDD